MVANAVRVSIGSFLGPVRVQSMGEQDWTAFEAQPVRERGVYDVEVVVGDRVQSPPVVIRLHFGQCPMGARMTTRSADSYATDEWAISPTKVPPLATTH